jgi:predicted methyltransferase MtxX (methanogen marker protein 4)
MKKIIDLIKSLLFGGGSVAEKIEEVKQLETAVKEEVKEVEVKVDEVKTKVKKQVKAIESEVAQVKAKVKKATSTKKPAAKKKK